MDNEQVVGLHMEVQEDGSLPVRVVYLENEDVLTDNQPIYIIPHGIDVDLETDSPSPVSSSTVSERATPEPPDTEENTNDAQEASGSNNRKRAHSDDGEPETEVDDADDGRLCPICYDNWTTAGEHRLCCLKCGHLFGLSCVTRWLGTQRRKSCPTCKKHVSRNDIRYIYAKKVIPVDTHVLESVRKQLVDVNCEKLQLQLDLSKSKCRESLLMQEVGELKKQLAARKTALTDSGVGQQQKSCSSGTRVKLYKDKSLEISLGCRVFDVNVRLNSIAVSSKSNSALFAGYGVRKVTISDYKLTTFLPLHSDAIRDMAFHRENNALLTASLDKTCKIVDYNTNSATIAFSCGVELWSCCWDCSNANVFYAGTRQGAVLKYDLRQPSSAMTTFSVSGDMSPVVSVASPTNHSLVACKLSSLWHFNQAENNTPTLFPIDGPFISMRCEPLTKQLLISARPTINFPYTRHLLFNIDKNFQCNVAHTFPVDSKPNFLSRSCFIMNDEGGERDYVAAHNENDKCVVLWSVNTGKKVGTVSAYEPVLDLCAFKLFNDEQYLVSLTEKKLDFFKFTKYSD